MLHGAFCWEQIFFTQFIYLASTLRSCFNFYSCIGVTPLQLRGSNSDACKQIRLDLAYSKLALPESTDYFIPFFITHTANLFYQHN